MELFASCSLPYPMAPSTVQHESILHGAQCENALFAAPQSTTKIRNMQSAIKIQLLRFFGNAFDRTCVTFEVAGTSSFIV